MLILYNPKDVGADRVANCRGHRLVRRPRHVVDLGTATTFDAISAVVEYFGGDHPRDCNQHGGALRASATLRRVELVEPRNVIGKSTVESIQSGAIYGYTGLVECAGASPMARAVRHHLHRRASGIVTPLSEMIEHHEPWLTLHGLRLVFDRNVTQRREWERDVREIGYRFETTSGAGEVARSFARLATGEESGVTVPTAGRLMLSRPQGKIAFAELRDWTGSIQLFTLAALTPDFDEFCRLSLGDWIGVSGEVIRTRRGELSVKVASWELLAQACRGFGGKWPVSPTPTSATATRARPLGQRRSSATYSFCSPRWSPDPPPARSAGFVEVERRCLRPIPRRGHGQAVHNAICSTHCVRVYLRIATELYLKRCVVGGMSRVSRSAGTFRNEGLSPRHDPEFTMLKVATGLWRLHRHDADLRGRWSRQECRNNRDSLSGPGGRPSAAPWRRATLAELIAEHTGVEVELSMGTAWPAIVGVPFEPSRYGPGKLMLEIYERSGAGG